MGNLFGKKAVHSRILKQKCDERRRMRNEPSSSLRIKVLLSRRQMKELMATADLSKDKSQLGRLILQQYLEGRSTGRVMGGQGLVKAENHVGKNGLSTILE